MTFEPIRTERLIVRRPVLSDADAEFQRRSHPDVARYQDWQMPYTREQAEASTARSAGRDEPSDKGMNLTVVAADEPERILGDLAVELRWEGRTGYFGYSFHPDYWGRGYATEASHALMHYLFDDRGVNRVESSLHPDNVASARVLEACGLVFEGHTIESFWVGEECSDDMLYGVTKQGWDAWKNRPRERPERVALVPVTAENSRCVAKLTIHKSQERFVAPMLGNLRDALVPPVVNGETLVPWYRAIEADGVTVGFLMAAEPTATRPMPSLWRLLVDRVHQRRGIASAALDEYEQRCRDAGATSVEVSWVAGPGSPAPMYLARGYEPTGEIDDGEIVAVKEFA